jgi:1,4-alpha-glucan branching enzyme
MSLVVLRSSQPKIQDWCQVESQDMIARNRAKRGVWILVILAVACGVAYLWFSGRQHPESPALPVSPPAPAAQEQEPRPAAAIKTTGNYSQDWMDGCAPLTGQAQADCTSRLDAAYGKTDAAPVPQGKAKN